MNKKGKLALVVAGLITALNLDIIVTFRWVIGQGWRRNQDNNYTFCPDRGFTKFQHNN